MLDNNMTHNNYTKNDENWDTELEEDYGDLVDDTNPLQETLFTQMRGKIRNCPVTQVQSCKGFVGKGEIDQYRCNSKINYGGHK